MRPRKLDPGGGSMRKILDRAFPHIENSHSWRKRPRTRSQTDEMAGLRRESAPTYCRCSNALHERDMNNAGTRPTGPTSPITLEGGELDNWAREPAAAAAAAMLESFHVDLADGTVWLGDRRVLVLQTQ